MRVFVTGASGLVGCRVISKLTTKHDIVAISRNIQRLSSLKSVECVEGDVTKQGAWQNVAAKCDAIVHLAGAGIMDKRWSRAYKTVLRESRVNSTKRCAEVGVDILVSTGIYGNRGDEVLTENSTYGSDFLSKLAIDWEEAANTSIGRVVTLRFGMMLDACGGALKKMSFPFRCGLGGPIGNGKQYWPWIHHEDACSMIEQALQNNWSGAFNAVAPNQVMCNSFTKAIGKALHRPAIVPVPSAALRLLIGEASSVLTASQRVIPKRLEDEGFIWSHKTLSSALDSELNS